MLSSPWKSPPPPPPPRGCYRFETLGGVRFWHEASCLPADLGLLQAGAGKQEGGVIHNTGPGCASTQPRPSRAAAVLATSAFKRSKDGTQVFINTSMPDRRRSSLSRKPSTDPQYWIPIGIGGTALDFVSSNRMQCEHTNPRWISPVLTAPGPQPHPSPSSKGSLERRKPGAASWSCRGARAALGR